MSDEQYKNLSSLLMNSISDDELIEAVRSFDRLGKFSIYNLLNCLVTIRPCSIIVDAFST
jgi:hypothetical protein